MSSSGKNIKAPSKAELAEIEIVDERLRKHLDFKTHCATFRLDDVFIEEYVSLWDKHPRIQKDRMGVPVKFKVVHISSEGIPYLRSLNSNGTPIGPLILPPQLYPLISMGLFRGTGNLLLSSALNAHEIATSPFSPKKEHAKLNRFIQDPAQLDAILLGQEYDPCVELREKKKLLEEISEHNKANLVRTASDYHIFKFLKSLKVGDKFWTTSGCYVVQTTLGQKNSKTQTIMLLDTKDQSVHSYKPSYFRWKRLYRAKPRSFAKESKT